MLHAELKLLLNKSQFILKKINFIRGVNIQERTMMASVGM